MDVESENVEFTTVLRPTFQPRSEGTSNPMVNILPDSMSDHNTTTLQLHSTLLQQPGESFIEREYPGSKKTTILKHVAPKNLNEHDTLKHMDEHDTLKNMEEHDTLKNMEEHGTLKHMEEHDTLKRMEEHGTLKRMEEHDTLEHMKDDNLGNKQSSSTNEEMIGLKVPEKIQSQNNEIRRLLTKPDSATFYLHESVPENQAKIPPPIKSKTSTDIISEIVNVCEKQIFGETSTIQMLLNICSKILKIPECLEFCSEINTVCNQILSETYTNSHVIIDLCQELTNMNVGSLAKTKKGSSKTHARKVKSKQTVGIQREEEDVEIDNEEYLDSDDSLNPDDDPDLTGNWETEDEKSKSGKREDDDKDWEPEVTQQKKRKKKYKGLKEGCKPTQLKKEAIQCLNCPKILYSQRAYDNHQKKHTKTTCDVCSITVNSYYLTQHMKIHTGDKPFICETCGSAFALMSSLAEHKLVHTGEKVYACPHCDYRAISVKRLRNHKVIHSIERKFQCDTCGASFKRSFDLKNHSRVHRDDRPFCCSVCNTRFKDNVKLRRHEQTHTDEYKYQCPVCGKRIRQAGNLKTHMRTHNGEKPYLCDFCGKGFAHNVTRKQHQEVCRRYPQDEVLIQ